MKVEDMESVIIIWFSSTGMAHRFISLDYEKKIIISLNTVQGRLRIYRRYPTKTGPHLRSF